MGSLRQNAPRATSSLRQAQRELTRSRIRESAKKNFYERHYSSATMDEIAAGADLSRATLYLHYKDKEEILEDIIREYTPRAIEVLARLPGPKPSFDEVAAWIKDVAGFVESELVPLSIFEDVRHVFPQGVDKLITSLTGAMGANNPVLAESATDSASPELRAKALLLLTELTYTSRWYCESPDREMAEALIVNTAKSFTQFLVNPRDFI